MAPVALDLDASIQWDDWRLGVEHDDEFFDFDLPTDTKAGDTLTFNAAWCNSRVDVQLPHNWVYPRARDGCGHDVSYRLAISSLDSRLSSPHTRFITGLHINGLPCRAPYLFNQGLGPYPEAYEARKRSAPAPAPAPAPEVVDEDDAPVFVGTRSREERDQEGWANAIVL
jgi:hypothetical protein